MFSSLLCSKDVPGDGGNDFPNVRSLESCHFGSETKSCGVPECFGSTKRSSGEEQVGLASRGFERSGSGSGRYGLTAIGFETSGVRGRKAVR